MSRLNSDYKITLKFSEHLYPEDDVDSVEEVEYKISKDEINNLSDETLAWYIAMARCLEEGYLPNMDSWLEPDIEKVERWTKMINFTWEEYRPEGSNISYIKWSASWDGDNSNDPLFDDSLSMYEKVQNPFSYTIDGEENPELKEIGDTVATNLITRSLCFCIQASVDHPELFKTTTGNTHAFGYRMSLLKCLSLLWD